MAYNVSQEFREQCYSGESLYSCRLIIGENTIPIEQIASITISSPIVDSNSETFYIGTFISQKLTIEFKNLDGIDTTSGTNVELYISQNVNGVDIEVPIGKYLIDESPENYYKSSKIDCLDYAIKFATNVDYSPSFVDGKTTIDNLLQWLCTYYGVTLGNYPNTNGNVEIGTYDSTVSGKRWISYIAEIKGCNAKMDRLGQLTLVPIKSSPAVTIDALKSASWELGEKFEISKVTFFDAIRNYTYGDDSENTLFIRQDNPFVIDTNVVQNIYNVVKDLQIWSSTCENYGDISLDAWDIIHYTLGDEDYYTLNNNTITYAMTIMSKIETKIPTKQQEVTTNVVGGNEQQQIRRLRTEVNTIDNTITLQAQQIATNTSNISTNTSNISTLNTNLNGLSASFTDFYDNEYIVEVANLQDQIDGAIQFWNGPAIPTLNNYPANQWTTEADRNNHRADIYTVIEDVEGELKQGKSYRFDKVGSTWQWVELTDNELSAVQALAQQALDKSNANEQYIADLNDELSNPTTTLTGTSFDIEDALDQPLQDFKMYGDTQQDSTPTPSTPQEIHNVSGDNTIEICGKNLLDKSNVIENKRIASDGTPYSDNGYKLSDYIKVQANTTYTYSRGSAGGGLSAIAYYDKDKTFISRTLPTISKTSTSGTITTPNNTEYVRIADINEVIDSIQIEKGSTATTYEPYTGQTQLISLGVENLFDYTKINAVSNGSNNNGVITATGGNCIVYFNTGGFSIKSGETLYFSADIKLNDSSTGNVNNINDGVHSGTTKIIKPTLSSSYQRYQTSYTYISDDSVNKMLIQFASLSGTAEISNIQISKNKSPSFTPYGTTPIELNKIGTYQDYIYKDSGKWYLHKEIGEVILDGTESWTYDSSRTRFYATIFPSATMVRGQGLCNYYRYGDSINSGCFDINVDKKTIYMFTPDSSITTSSAFKTWLSTHNTIVYYVLAEPIDISIEDWSGE